MAKKDRSGFKLDRSYFNCVDKGAVRQRCRGLTPELTATAFPLGLSIDIANSNMFVQGANDYPCKNSFNGVMTKYVQNSPQCKVLYGSRLGWLIDPEDLSVLGLLPEQQPVSPFSQGETHSRSGKSKVKSQASERRFMTCLTRNRTCTNRQSSFWLVKDEWLVS